jgi:hypothetical protein
MADVGTPTVRRRRRTVSLRELEREAARRRRGRGLPIVDDGDDGNDDGRAVAGADASLPALRSACRGGARPCPLVSCRYHLYLDVDAATGSIKMNFPDLEPWELACSCALDVAEEGGLTLDVVGEKLGLTRERTRQIEALALARIATALTDPHER